MIDWVQDGNYVNQRKAWELLTDRLAGYKFKYTCFGNANADVKRESKETKPKKSKENIRNAFEYIQRKAPSLESPNDAFRFVLEEVNDPNSPLYDSAFH